VVAVVSEQRDRGAFHLDSALPMVNHLEMGHRDATTWAETTLVLLGTLVSIDNRDLIGIGSRWPGCLAVAGS
jgi:hypothetical protein